MLPRRVEVKSVSFTVLPFVANADRREFDRPALVVRSAVAMIVRVKLEE